MLLEQAVSDGLLRTEDIRKVQDYIASGNGIVATGFAHRYILGLNVRQDDTLSMRWHFQAGVYGSCHSARHCARFLSGKIMEAAVAHDTHGDEVGDSGMIEALAALAWWTAWSNRQSEPLSDAERDHRFFVAGLPARLILQVEEGLKTRNGRVPDDSVKRQKAGRRDQHDDADDDKGAWSIDDAAEDGFPRMAVLDARPTLRPAIDTILTGKDGAPKRYTILNERLPLPHVEDLDSLEAGLTMEFPYAAAAIGLIMRDLRIGARWGRKGFMIRPTLLVGPPGTGKTRLINRLGQLTGVRTRVISCAGSSDNRDVEGTSRGFSSANPSFIARFLAGEKVGGGIIAFDEIDKAATGSQNGSLRDSLINLLEPQNGFHDQCLQTRLDLTGMSFLATANDVSRLPMPLISRFRIVDVPVPKIEHLPALVRGIRIDLAGEYGIDARLLPELEDAEMTALEQHYCRTRNIRSLCRAVEIMIDHRDRHTPVH